MTESEKVKQLFQASRYYVFEDGYSNPFTDAIESMILRGNQETVWLFLVHALLNSGRNAACWTLRTFGNVEHEPTREYRRMALETALGSSDSNMRDAAGLGLASMDDPLALPALRDALRYERLEWAKRDLQQVIDQLETTAQEAQ